jgi:hypothetical protein
LKQKNEELDTTISDLNAAVGEARKIVKIENLQKRSG